MVTTALNAPSVSPVMPVTVKEVAVEAVTVPVPDGLKTTVLLPGVVEKLVPVIVRVVALLARFAVLCVTVGGGITVATCTAVPLLSPLLVTTAFKAPAVSPVRPVTVREVVVEAVTVPVPVGLKTTVLLPGVVEKPVPVIVSVDALRARSAVLSVTVASSTMSLPVPPAYVNRLATPPSRIWAPSGLPLKVPVVVLAEVLSMRVKESPAAGTKPPWANTLRAALGSIVTAP